MIRPTALRLILDGSKFHLDNVIIVVECISKADVDVWTAHARLTNFWHHRQKGQLISRSSRFWNGSKSAYKAGSRSARNLQPCVNYRSNQIAQVGFWLHLHRTSNTAQMRINFNERASSVQMRESKSAVSSAQIDLCTSKFSWGRLAWRKIDENNIGVNIRHTVHELYISRGEPNCWTPETPSPKPVQRH